MTVVPVETLDVSVLVPAKDEADNLPEFLQRCAQALGSAGFSFEVIVVNDGSRDGSERVLRDLERQYPFLAVVTHRRQRGIADSLRSAGDVARGDIFVFYPADLQYLPEDIPALVAPILEGRADIVTGTKQGKYEKAFVSGIYNALSRALFHVPVKDLNSVKAYRREIMDALPVRPDWHRYMIVIAAAQGFTVTEIPVPVYPRHAGHSKFGLSRIPIGMLDMLSVWFELKFGEKPLLLFGMMGAALFAVSTVAGIVALVFVRSLAVRPLWTLIQTCLILGSIFFVTGLLGEQIAGQRAEVREMRRQLDEAQAGRERQDFPRT